MPETPMLSRPIPSTGEMMPVIGLGTWPVFDVGAGESARRPLREVVRLLLDAGAKMIDSSPMYGRAEAVTGDLLADLQARPRAFLATKVWTTGRERGIEQMRRSAALLRSEVVDLMQIHNLVDWRTHLATLRRMKEAGRHPLYRHHPLHRPGAFRTRPYPRNRARHRLCAMRLFAGGASGRARIAAGGGGARGRGHRQPAARARRPVAPGARPSPPRLGPGIRLHKLGAAAAQICPGRAYGHLRDPGDAQPRAHAGKSRRRASASLPDHEAAATDPGVVGRNLASAIKVDAALCACEDRAISPGSGAMQMDLLAVRCDLGPAQPMAA